MKTSSVSIADGANQEGAVFPDDDGLSGRSRGETVLPGCRRESRFFRNNAGTVLRAAHSAERDANLEIKETDTDYKRYHHCASEEERYLAHLPHPLKSSCRPDFSAGS